MVVRVCIGSRGILSILCIHVRFFGEGGLRLKSQQRVGVGKKVAERAGFEPAVAFEGYDGLANRCFRPLSHLSPLST